MPPPAPLDAARVRGVLARITTEERELAERLRLSDEFRDHCETNAIGQTWGALFAFVLWHGRGRIWSVAETAAEHAARRQPYGAVEAQDPWLRLKTIVQRGMSAADEAAEAAGLVSADTEANPLEVDSVSQRVERSGRPPRYDWLEFAKEVVRIANTPDGLPDREAMQRHMMAWCRKTWGKSPHPATVRHALQKLWP
jgi:hypothetical protein